MLQLSVLDCGGGVGGRLSHWSLVSSSLGSLSHWSTVTWSLWSLLAEVRSVQHTEWVQLGDIFLGGSGGLPHWVVRPLVLHLVHRSDVSSRSLLAFLASGLPLLVRHQPLQELYLSHEQSRHKGSSLWFIHRHFLAHFRFELVMVGRRPLVPWLTILNSGVEISHRDLSQDY